MGNESRIGTILDGRYRLDACLATGGFGTVYRATHLPTGVDVAIKLLHEELAHDASIVARFAREADALLRLRDQHTVTTYEYGTSSAGPFIAMELLRGESLADRLARRRVLPWREVALIARAVCAALAEAHALGIVHRDLKPGNIHIEPDGGEHVKVIDFGIAKALADSELVDHRQLTQVGDVLGTLEYMSPEQLLGGEVDHRADLYALGVVMYELVTGVRPFQAERRPGELAKAMLSRVPAPAGCAALDPIIACCLRLAADDRFADAGELAQALDAVIAERWLDGSTVIVPESDEVTWVRRRPELPTLRG